MSFCMPTDLLALMSFCMPTNLLAFCYFFSLLADRSKVKDQVKQGGQNGERLKPFASVRGKFP